MGDLKSRTLNVRVVARDDDLFRRAAATQSETLTEFLVESGRERAERLLADRTRFALSQADWQRFEAALERPPAPAPALRELFERSRPE
jgi:uncharacterized protein (DUF1778 family)